MKTILGTGQLGLAIMEALLHDNPNEALLLVNRSGRLDVSLPAQVQLRSIDVCNPQEVERIAQQSEVIFSCTDVLYQAWGSFYPAAASALAHALNHTQAKLVFADNLYSYGNVKGAVMSETMPHGAKTHKGLIRANVIDTLLGSTKTYHYRVALVKAADFIGPRIHKGVFGIDFLDRLYHNKTIVLMGKTALPHTFTYIHDFARAMINVANANDAFGQIWHVPNSPAMNLNEWVQLFEEKSHRKAHIMTLPKSVVWLAGWFNSLVAELYELAYQFEYPYLVSHEKYVNRFGNHATCPSDIVSETLKWYENK
ncbi:MAG: NAD-dependent epimerase/dehydratase family protein [Spirosomataceae bacterium]